MKVAVFSSKEYDESFLTQENARTGNELDLHFLHERLTDKTAHLANGHDAVCAFVNDVVNADVLQQLADAGVRIVALRCTGANNVDLAAARSHGITVVRVPGYSPAAIAEHALALMFTLNRKVHKAYDRTRHNNFALDGLLGFDFAGKTIGVLGTGAIGTHLALACKLGLRMRVLAYDLYENPKCKEAGVEYLPSVEDVLAQSDVVSLHLPLTKDTTGVINAERIALMKDGVMLINTGRGPLLDTRAVISGLRSGKIGYLGIDVYEKEQGLFFDDHSDEPSHDDTLAILKDLPNVIITGHQAFFTREAVTTIARSTVDNLLRFAKGTLPEDSPNIVRGF